MCFEVKHHIDSRFAEAKIAKYNITVLKRVARKRLDNDYFKQSETKFFSEWQSFEYETGYHYKNNNFPLKTNKAFLEREGLHSWLPSEMHYHSLIFRTLNGYDSYVIIKCLIPAGTPYYKSDIEIISRELIIVGILNNEEKKEIIKRKAKQEIKKRKLYEEKRRRRITQKAKERIRSKK